MRNFRSRFSGKTFLLIGIVAAAVLQAKAQNTGEFTFRKHNAPVKAVAFSDDGKTLATGGEDKLICLWDLTSGELTGTIKNAFSVKSIRFTGDGNLLAACGSSLVLMDMQGKTVRTFSGYTTDIWSFSYNRITRRVVAGSYAKSIKIWDFNTAKPLLTLEGHEKSCLPVCFNPSGSLVASGSLDLSVRLWNAADGKQKSIMDIHSGNIFAIDFHPSGKYFASASADKTIRLWNAETGKIVRTFSGHKGAIFDIMFSSDGNHLISCDAENTILLWETATGKMINTFANHTGAVNSVRFRPDGRAFASASDDQTVIYRILKGKDYLEGSYFEKEIEQEVSGSPLFAPKGSGESRQDFAARQAEAERLLDTLYEKHLGSYFEMLNKIPIE